MLQAHPPAESPPTYKPRRVSKNQSHHPNGHSQQLHAPELRVFEHRHYLPLHPTCNKLLAKRWEEYARSLHLQKLKDAQHTIDDSKPQAYRHLDMRLKKQQMEEERVHDIEKNNNILFQRIMYQKICHNDISAFGQLRAFRDNRNSIIASHAHHRNRGNEKISRENLIILQRIEDKAPNYNRLAWYANRYRNLEYLCNISQYPKHYFDQLEEGKANYDLVRPKTEYARRSLAKSLQRPTKAQTAPQVFKSNAPRPKTRGLPVSSPLEATSSVSGSLPARSGEVPSDRVSDASTLPVQSDSQLALGTAGSRRSSRHSLANAALADADNRAVKLKEDEESARAAISLTEDVDLGIVDYSSNSSPGSKNNASRPSSTGWSEFENASDGFKTETQENSAADQSVHVHIPSTAFDENSSYMDEDFATNTVENASQKLKDSANTAPLEMPDLDFENNYTFESAAEQNSHETEGFHQNNQTGEEIATEYQEEATNIMNSSHNNAEPGEVHEKSRISEFELDNLVSQTTDIDDVQSTTERKSPSKTDEIQLDADVVENNSLFEGAYEDEPKVDEDDFDLEHIAPQNQTELHDLEERMQYAKTVEESQVMTKFEEAPQASGEADESSDLKSSEKISQTDPNSLTGNQDDATNGNGAAIENYAPKQIEDGKEKYEFDDDVHFDKSVLPADSVDNKITDAADLQFDITETNNDQDYGDFAAGKIDLVDGSSDSKESHAHDFETRETNGALDIENFDDNAGAESENVEYTAKKGSGKSDSQAALLEKKSANRPAHVEVDGLSEPSAVQSSSTDIFLIDNEVKNENATLRNSGVRNQNMLSSSGMHETEENEIIQEDKNPKTSEPKDETGAALEEPQLATNQKNSNVVAQNEEMSINADETKPSGLKEFDNQATVVAEGWLEHDADNIDSEEAQPHAEASGVNAFEACFDHTEESPALAVPEQMLANAEDPENSETFDEPTKTDFLKQEASNSMDSEDYAQQEEIVEGEDEVGLKEQFEGNAAQPDYKLEYEQQKTSSGEDMYVEKSEIQPKTAAENFHEENYGGDKIAAAHENAAVNEINASNPRNLEDCERSEAGAEKEAQATAEFESVAETSIVQEVKHINGENAMVPDELSKSFANQDFESNMTNLESKQIEALEEKEDSWGGNENQSFVNNDEEKEDALQPETESETKIRTGSVGKESYESGVEGSVGDENSFRKKSPLPPIESASRPSSSKNANIETRPVSARVLGPIPSPPTRSKPSSRPMSTRASLPALVKTVSSPSSRPLSGIKPLLANLKQDIDGTELGMENGAALAENRVDTTEEANYLIRTEGGSVRSPAAKSVSVARRSLGSLKSVDGGSKGSSGRLSGARKSRAGSGQDASLRDVGA